MEFLQPRYHIGLQLLIRLSNKSHTVASLHTQVRDTDEAEAFIEQVAAEHNLADLRALRVAAKAAAAATPRAIRRAATDGMKPPRIADELGRTPSYVYRILREQQAAAGDQ
ncbi:MULTISPECIES: helix-turn-helix domain-containing protein [unclassified Streptomyces]|uniref:helix-turn-helix domain-containing protein n=1 Tax=unclassified Streptomyces TaxID=2593676 RepID=UPI002D2184D6|nr:helix-turn-helix domain-containing protein [Streptomyces sp. BoleA5]